jgi:hypothetical protein
MSLPNPGAHVDVPPAHAGALALSVLAGFGVSLALLYPGQYTYDSAFQIWQARSGEFYNITPVPMLWVWSRLLWLFDNPASLLILNLAMFWAGLGLCMQALAAPIGVRLCGVLLCGLNPLTLAMMAQMLSDPHMTAAMFLATGLLAHVIRSGRTWPVWVAGLTILYAGSIRQNALLAVIPLGVLVVAVWKTQQRMTMRRILIAATATAVLTAAFAIAIDRLIADERRPLWPMLALWDLAAMSVASNELLLPPFTHGAGLSVEELRETGAFNPVSTTPLFARSRSGIGSGLDVPFSSEQRAALARAWWNAVSRHPGAYLEHRVRTMALLTGRHGGASGGISYYVGRTTIRDNPPLPEAWFPTAQKRLYDLFAALGRSWLFAGLPYLLIHLIVIPIAWRRRTPTADLALAVSTSALFYSASFFVLAPSAELRYLTWPIVAAPLALVLLIARRNTFAEVHGKPVGAA